MEKCRKWALGRVALTAIQLAIQWAYGCIPFPQILVCKLKINQNQIKAYTKIKDTRN